MDKESYLKNQRLLKLLKFGLFVEKGSSERKQLEEALSYEPNSEERIKGLKLFYNKHFNDIGGWIENKKAWTSDQKYLVRICDPDMDCDWLPCLHDMGVFKELRDQFNDLHDQIMNQSR